MTQEIVQSQDYAQALLAEMLQEFGKDGHGGEFEDGEHPLIDRVRAYLISAQQLAAPQPPDVCPAQSKCDTPGYCRSVMRCTAMDEKRAGGTNAN